MIRLTEKLDSPQPTDISLSLSIDQRIRSRLKVTLDDGRDAGLFLPRGLILRGGDCLRSECGRWLKSKPQQKLSQQSVAMILCCWPGLVTTWQPPCTLQIAPGFVRYQHDHVLDAMVEGLGVKVVCEQQPFEPEAGAYSSENGQHHGHNHDHDHTHTH
ncbi:urease accessory protein UreE [Nitrincola sp. A-D6]|uniref:urease accessory protein UreE n=1 Tax=Nitrincola sp. A-D6 TaxID=1545442 RepID=UPI000B2CC6DD|nr:urease accessory protein UreE [Nitrincola sp. A-D6]